MTRDAKASAAYSNGGDEGVRNGFAAKVFGVLQALELESSLNLSGIMDADWFPVNEFQVDGAKRTGLIKRKFRGKVMPPIPDVLAKRSAINIWHGASDDGIEVAPCVWNNAAYEDATKNGFNPILGAPSIPYLDGSVQTNFDLIALKSSGSGMPGATSEKFDLFAQSMPDKAFVYYGPDENVIYKDGKRIPTKRRHGRLGHHEPFDNMSNDMPGVIFGYPSENAQFVANMAAHGWPGVHVMLPPRGWHETQNRHFELSYRLAAQGLSLDEGLTEVKLRKLLKEVQEGAYKSRSVPIGTRKFGEIFKSATR